MTDGISKHFILAAKRCGIPLTRFVLAASVRRQRMWLFERFAAWRNEDLHERSQLQEWTAPSPHPSLPPRGRGGVQGLDPRNFLRGILSKTSAGASTARFEIPNAPISTSSGPSLVVFRASREYRISTSRFGIGQVSGSNRTPLGLHRIARKIGGGHPIGTVFKGRQPIGYTWQGDSAAPIAHRILWLAGLEPGFNAGGNVDSFQRYIYIHGTTSESALGTPASSGCIHLGADDLLPLFDRIPPGTLVWIES